MLGGDGAAAVRKLCGSRADITNEEELSAFDLTQEASESIFHLVVDLYDERRRIFLRQRNGCQQKKWQNRTRKKHHVWKGMNRAVQVTHTKRSFVGIKRHGTRLSRRIRSRVRQLVRCCQLTAPTT